MLLHLNIARAAIEKSLEGIDVAVLLNDNTIIGDSRNLQLTRSLREHDILLPRDGTVLATIEGLNLKTLLLRQRNLTGVETLQVGHLTTQLGQSDKSIYLISQQDGLLFTDVLLGGTNMNEEVTARDSTACRTQLTIAPTLLTTLLATALLLGLTTDLDTYLIRGNGLAIDSTMSRRNGKRTIFRSNHNIGIGDGRRA